VTTKHRAAALLAALAALLPGAAAGQVVIVQKDRAFSQDKIVVHAGDRLVFRNEDSVSHNVFSRTPGFEFEVKVQLPGQDTAVPFDRPGTAEVRCAIHPEMKLQVVVEPKE
jgi:plastocyanin